jgi:SAM-dependent methyltransferase
MRKKNGFLYNGKVGRWWLRHSLDAEHSHAYRKIADFIRDSYVREPRVIVDYACGPGQMLALLSSRFPSSKLTGLDGSSLLIREARNLVSMLPEQCANRISLIETPLPNLRLLRGKADMALFCFPNIVPFADEDNSGRSGLCISENDRRVAECLSRAADVCDRTGGDSNPAANQLGLEQGRCISLNLRRLLVRGGICVRVEYATMQRHELSPIELSHVSFEEGSLDARVEGRMPRRWFRLVASAFFRSRVLEDVYEQTGDDRDKDGGYLITVLRAI